jgi:hypothetical protein
MKEERGSEREMKEMDGKGMRKGKGEAGQNNCGIMTHNQM